MPTVLRRGAYRFFFYSGDGAEPPHIHVERGDCTAKFWLRPVAYQRSRGFARQELNRIEKHLEENSSLLLGSWYDFFGD